MSNSKKYPMAWGLFIEHARNIEGLGMGAKYQIPHPKRDGSFIQADDPGVLFAKFNKALQGEDHIVRVYEFINLA